MIVVKEQIISISMVTPEPVVKKEVIKPKKKIIKKKVIKKKIVKKTIEKVIPVKKEIVKVVEPKVEQVVKRVVEKKVTPKPVVSKPIVPTFDAKMKTSFIAGLYEALSEKKYYPKMAKRRKLEGVVTVSFTLCKDGTIKNIFLNKSCGHKILDKAALKVVKSIDIYKAIPDAVSLTALNLNIPIKYLRG
ncbi:MAG: energy transducer TonB [Sulfurimonas sp.]|nr:energy transducer TonB [Sulfurimonas sp.]